MDPLDILENLDHVKPVFQPVVSAVKHKIAGYEILGRYQSSGEWLSLADFFHDADVPDEYKAEVDHHLLQLAVAEMLHTGNEGQLFINRNAKQLLIDGGEAFLNSLLEFEKQGFSINRLVLEITEHDFEERFDVLNHLLMYFKTYGMQIAVDHVGAKSSNIDRIRQIKPHILKIDTGIIRQSSPDVFQDILYSVSLLARRIGAKLSYEKIEDDHQLYFAWKNGGHYYQGFHLAKPAFAPLIEDDLQINVSEKVIGFIHREKSMVKERLAFALACEEKMKKIMAKWHGPEAVDTFLEFVTQSFDKESFRIYVCNSDGQQVSSNFRKQNSHWEVEQSQKGSHWGFRPYFLENILHMRTWHKGILSDSYADIETAEMIRTFSYPLSDKFFLFIDISYSFIFEHDFLLLE
jgi:EAL domain-containing protein (putative c-di-GMP-specific phosphodiesterase class I)